MRVNTPKDNFFQRWLSYPRSIIGGILLLLVTAGYCTFSLLVVPFFRDFKNVGDLIIHSWGVVTCSLFGVKIEVVNPENLPKGGCLFLFNHTSQFDIMIFHAAFKKHARFGAKIELFKIPIFGKTMTAFGALPITRGDLQKVIDVYRASIPRVHAGESFILAAEGTRLPRPGVGDKLKSGPIIFAIEGQFPVVPVVIVGAYEILPKSALFPSFGRWHNHVRVKVLPPVSTQGLNIDDRHKVAEQIRAQMTKAFQDG